MRLLLDTHMVIWVAAQPDRMPLEARDLAEDWRNSVFFSPVSLWEIAVKSGLDRDDFRADVHMVRQGLLDNGFEELVLTGRHAAAVRDLPNLHRDPFDRMLIAQATAEKIHLLTADEIIARYPGDILFTRAKRHRG